mmetsp:Transcript_35102/g.81197  ORF Transcript_35102/g.81197 Transcript_35102/m.81197 type:complete len:218 (-) Transcript_35102:40-693(-)
MLAVHRRHRDHYGPVFRVDFDCNTMRRIQSGQSLTLHKRIVLRKPPGNSPSSPTTRWATGCQAASKECVAAITRQAGLQSFRRRGASAPSSPGVTNSTTRVASEMPVPVKSSSSAASPTMIRAITLASEPASAPSARAVAARAATSGSSSIPVAAAAEKGERTAMWSARASPQPRSHTLSVAQQLASSSIAIMTGASSGTQPPPRCARGTAAAMHAR